MGTEQSVKAWLARRANGIPAATLLRVVRDGRAIETFALAPDSVEATAAELATFTRPDDVIAAYLDAKAPAPLCELPIEKPKETLSIDSLPAGAVKLVTTAIAAATREATRGSDRAIDSLEQQLKDNRARTKELEAENDRYRKRESEGEATRLAHIEKMTQLQIEARQSDEWMGKAFELGGMVIEDWALRGKVGAVLVCLQERKPALLAEVMTTIDPAHAKALLGAMDAAQTAKEKNAKALAEKKLAIEKART